ncbi:2-isopropylmalate/homocitrate synthetase [Thermoplasma volcanium GSS1]|uniref:2-isopropylmalate synthase n=1 Tax=Thermoplasma volcanium (strain ATCC 51530 / DSM 4299 / JCM 9571 / NBRC 15438 / GSS1) TaxID=273116 RepID=Q97A78_THEVO|nr:LeuA family protein [Thermoplasma volcanium]BAB60074.1 2-isopropylmalate/homocitrate synthetase [Thermoplasma volcanium GSS1]
MLTDDTLREGMQAPGIAFTLDEKIRIAQSISKSGIKRALVSYPSAHESEVEAARKITDLHLFDDTYSLGRSIKEDVDSIISTGSKVTLHLPFGDYDINKICDVVKYASDHSDSVEIAIVDMVKYEKEKIFDLAKKLWECGASIVQIPDTTGRATPKRVHDVVSYIKQNLKVKVEVHCHNDHGLAIANSIAGIEAGCDYVDTTIFGIGERNGIADTASIASYLEKAGYEDKINFEMLRKTYDLMSELILRKAGYRFFADNMPIFGRNVLSITAGTHSTSKVFPNSRVSLNVYAGSRLVASILRKNGIEPDERKVKLLVSKIKDLSSNEGRVVGEDEVLKIYGGIL